MGTVRSIVSTQLPPSSFLAVRTQSRNRTSTVTSDIDQSDKNSQSCNHHEPGHTHAEQKHGGAGPSALNGQVKGVARWARWFPRGGAGEVALIGEVPERERERGRPRSQFQGQMRQSSWALQPNKFIPLVVAKAVTRLSPCWLARQSTYRHDYPETDTMQTSLRGAAQMLWDSIRDVGLVQPMFAESRCYGADSSAHWRVNKISSSQAGLAWALNSGVGRFSSWARRQFRPTGRHVRYNSCATAQQISLICVAGTFLPERCPCPSQILPGGSCQLGSPVLWANRPTSDMLEGTEELGRGGN